MSRSDLRVEIVFIVDFLYMKVRVTIMHQTAPYRSTNGLIHTQYPDIAIISHPYFKSSELGLTGKVSASPTFTLIFPPITL